MHELTSFQDAMSRALEHDGSSLEPWLDSAECWPGLSVYRNTVARGRVDALVGIFPTVVRMVGETWFRAAASVYAMSHNPTTPSLLNYGADFDAWLAEFPPAADTPFLASIARIDRLWWDCYFAADGQSLGAQAFSDLDAAALEVTSARLHPTLRLARFEQNIATLWLVQQPGPTSPENFEIEERAEYLVLWRPNLDVEPRCVDSATFEFLSACMEGDNLLDASRRALAADPQASLPNMIAAGIGAGWFWRLRSTQQDDLS